MREISLVIGVLVYSFCASAQTSTPNFVPGLGPSVGPGVFGLPNPVS